jgi:hypothetical protein
VIGHLPINAATGKAVDPLDREEAKAWSPI